MRPARTLEEFLAYHAPSIVEEANQGVEQVQQEYRVPENDEAHNHKAQVPKHR